MVALNGLIAVDVESLFKDQRAVTILEENNFRANVICIDSRKVTVGVIADMSPAFFMPSGVVAGNQISDGAKKNGYTTATYSPFYTPMVIASWAPMAKIVSSNKIAKVAAESGSTGNNYNVALAKPVNVVLTKKRWQHLPNSAAMISPAGLLTTNDALKSNSAAMYLVLTSYAINGFETISNRNAARNVALQIAGLFERQGHQHSHANNSFEVDVDIRVMDGINNFTNKAIESKGKNNKLMIEQVGRAKTYIDEERQEKSREALAKDLHMSGPVTI